MEKIRETDWKRTIGEGQGEGGRGQKKLKIEKVGAIRGGGEEVLENVK